MCCLSSSVLVDVDSKKRTEGSFSSRNESEAEHALLEVGHDGGKGDSGENENGRNFHEFLPADDVSEHQQTQTYQCAHHQQHQFGVVADVCILAEQVVAHREVVEVEGYLVGQVLVSEAAGLCFCALVVFYTYLVGG